MVQRSSKKFPIVHTLRSFDDGSGPALYVGGSFSSAGDLETWGLARWNGDDWSVVGAGIVGEARTIEVIDQGHGMSEEFVRTQLFQPFASTKETGFGIGAFEARTLIQSMGGRIEVESREGEGSRFTIPLPAGEPDSASEQKRMTA